MTGEFKDTPVEKQRLILQIKPISCKHLSGITMCPDRDPDIMPPSSEIPFLWTPEEEEKQEYPIEDGYRKDTFHTIRGSTIKRWKILHVPCLRDK